jgi:hypothetical protein
MPIILTTWEAEIGRITVQGQSGQIVPENPFPKITREKWPGDRTQVVKCLFCKP